MLAIDLVIVPVSVARWADNRVGVEIGLHRLGVGRTAALTDPDIGLIDGHRWSTVSDGVLVVLFPCLAVLEIGCNGVQESSNLLLTLVLALIRDDISDIGDEIA